MKLTRIVTLLLVAILCLSAVACDNGSKTPADTTPKASDTTPATPSDTTPATPSDTTPATPSDTTPATPSDTTTATSSDTTAPGGDDVTPENAEAKIGDTYYETLSDAVDEATDGCTVTLLRDIETTEAVVPYLEGCFTLDGDNHKITANITAYPYMYIMGGDIIIKDLDIDYTEMSDSADAYGAVKIDKLCSATFENVNITAYKNNVIYVTGSGKAIVKSGTYTVAEGNSVAYGNVFDVRSGGTLVVDGGEFNRNDTGIVRAMIRLDKKANVTINDGDFYSATGRIIFTNGNDAADAVKTFTINGGSFESGAAGVKADPMFSFGNNVYANITGGEFKVNDGEEAGVLFAINNANAHLSITGGKFINATGSLFSVTKELTTPVEISNAEFDNSAKGRLFNIDALSGGELETLFQLESGSFTYADASEANSIKSLAGISARITDAGGTLTVN